MIYENPKKFKSEVKISLKRHVEIVNKHVKRGTYFFDYGNAFLLEASKAEADILKKDGSFKYPSSNSSISRVELQEFKLCKTLGQAIFSPSNTAYIAHIGGALTRNYSKC